MKVQVVRDIHGNFEVHKAGCRDLDNGGKFDRSEVRLAEPEDVESRFQVAEGMYGYGAGSFFEEQARYDDYRDFIASCIAEFHFAPCVEALESVK